MQYLQDLFTFKVDMFNRYIFLGLKEEIEKMWELNATLIPAL